IRLLISKNGTRTKTVRNVPNMLPNVATEYRLPETVPMFDSDFAPSFIA
ncbi:MAG: hypothetical protein GWN01_00085, partial [Nitrosopumilaceae archaeon]|nr:hypothetical protein [Nitrosopumilaceae archaeon]NIV64594.1 hypothetical protein [Nitrosopumilaceae archaeon]NIX59988.1 hypothetical protein [Nitrosopumilaceae archaeon]